MSRFMTRTCHSDTVYGQFTVSLRRFSHTVNAESLTPQGVAVPVYGVYGFLFPHTPYILRIKKLYGISESARVSEKIHRKHRKHRKPYISNRYKSTLVAVYGF